MELGSEDVLIEEFLSLQRWQPMSSIGNRVRYKGPSGYHPGQVLIDSKHEPCLGLTYRRNPGNAPAYIESTHTMSLCSFTWEVALTVLNGAVPEKR